MNRVPASERLTFDVTVQNQGESEETDLGVSVSITNGDRINVDQTIPRIAAGESETVSIPIPEAPEHRSRQHRDGRRRPGPGRRDPREQPHPVPGGLYGRMNIAVRP